MKKTLVFLVFFFGFAYQSLFAQNPEPSKDTPQKTRLSFSVYDGVVVVGYVDEGGFSNFTGPSISLTHQQTKFILSALPSLRYKEDTSIGTKNAFITPTLGIGFTYTYKILAFQIPLYYNSKTATKNGEWVVGFGIGLRLNPLNKTK